MQTLWTFSHFSRTIFQIFHKTQRKTNIRKKKIRKNHPKFNRFI